MQTIGMIGGMSWESTVTYYQVINTAVKQRLGGFHSAKCLMYSVDFDELEVGLTAGDWEGIATLLCSAAQTLERAGADFIIICTNTMHRVADRIQQGLSIPILHIAEATADALLESGVRTAALLGTRYTMEQDFYRAKLEQRGLRVIVPGAADREIINDVIFDELCLGTVSETSKAEYLRIIAQLAEGGAEAVILGCTEIGMLIHQEDTPVKLFDTALIHARSAAERALG